MQFAFKITLFHQLSVNILTRSLMLKWHMNNEQVRLYILRMYM